MILKRPVLISLACAGMAVSGYLRAEVIVERDQTGRVVYRRTANDVVFLAGGRIGYVPKGADPVLWYAYDRGIHAFCATEGVDPALAKSIIWVESRFNWRCTSNKNARGLMQVIDSTARRMNHPSPGSYDPIENLRAGIKYIGFLQRLFDGNLIKIVAGYNSGEGNVMKYGGVPPFRETVNYTTQVLDRWSKMTRGIA
jgi:hypothetical protein